MYRGFGNRSLRQALKKKKKKKKKLKKSGTMLVESLCVVVGCVGDVESFIAEIPIAKALELFIRFMLSDENGSRHTTNESVTKVWRRRCKRRMQTLENKTKI